MNKLLTGFTLGLLVGVLFAPERGIDTRQKIADKGNDLKNQFADFIDSLANKFENSADEVEDYVNEKTDTLRAENI